MTFNYSLSELNSIAKEVIQASSSKTVLFKGEMGVGKTTLIKEIVKMLGSEDQVSSPTFSLVNEYQLKDGLAYHFDFYRINDLEEVYQIGVEDYLYSGHWCLIEWPEKVNEILPKNSTVVEIKKHLNDERTLTIL
ncbi:tRNA (adenosine(37)-N6)-threonylcarbamoyltransferase complex ATPase subunit type 1 TsaE [Galbibacter mesophilus]|uniref:tRNA (adenosine(37)-N6)-threonylcarbamoyltransferase complex ATPase subunit type 1 TsaE n=1 Tax=Galbibacter mesophilus TaxID=379069 RepID=UPI00191E29C4|nr:tRNA (adenosine(37)-N6)-threonylcarbamoyltransferase complex ATPase subunit type 1 TsaE [Galbibacter mesophilus]MCM5663193.1 tRNA (adenosine(37)-N6)-threonylcarbamoyltransferase complex ATPase subunit type 1 TsaE [Galbibacter mesophilus]